MSLEPESASWFRLDAKWREEARTAAAARDRQLLAEKVARGVERTSAPRVPLTMDALIGAIGKRVDDGGGWDLLKRQQYAEHLVQPWCSCEVDNGWRDDAGGWELCRHAVDEGF
jgi:hypothetical protein